MRSSNRTKILEAAARVLQRDGIRGFTYDAVGAESGLTKGGLLYHFASREDLVGAVHEYLAGQWEAAMVTAMGKSPDVATPTERYAAYLEVNTTGVSRAELLFMIEGSTTPAYFAPWDAVMTRWAPPIPTSDVTEEELERLIARLASDGMWLFEAIAQPLDPELRQVVFERLISKIKPPT